MHAPTPSAIVSAPRSPILPTPRTSSTPATTASTPAAWSTPPSAPRNRTETISTSTGAAARATGYTKVRSARDYAVASRKKYRSASAPEGRMYGTAAPLTSHVSAATGANSTAPQTSPTAVVAYVSPASASSVFHSACTAAEASTSPSAAAL